MASCSIWGAPMSRSRSAGLRIELGEVQAALAGLDGVDNAVVIAREDRPGDKRLVGYVTGAVADPAQLRARLAEQLLFYMVPTAVVVVEALPLTVNGKLDIRALQAPEYQDVDPYRARPARSRRSWPVFMPGYSAWSGSGSMTRFLISAAIRCRRCGWSPRCRNHWMRTSRFVICSTHQRFAS